MARSKEQMVEAVAAVLYRRFTSNVMADWDDITDDSDEPRSAYLEAAEAAVNTALAHAIEYSVVDTRTWSTPVRVVRPQSLTEARDIAAECGGVVEVRLRTAWAKVEEAEASRGS